MKTYLILIALFFLCATSYSQQQREFYQIKKYTVKTGFQENTVDEYLKNAYLPALHEAGIKDIGVFKPIEKETDTLNAIYVLIPFSSMDQFLTLKEKLAKNKSFQNAGSAYINATPEEAPYLRIESILLKAFKDMPLHQTPTFDSERSDRVYELRSYESATEKLHANKVHMFNEGGEIKLFEELNFNAVFYAQVISGSRMPNLMYMTSFENMESREAHWKAFVDSPVWKNMTQLPEYKTPNVSHIDVHLLYPTEYSDY